LDFTLSLVAKPRLNTPRFSRQEFDNEIEVAASDVRIAHGKRLFCLR
jgi:hypothetical protein